MIPYLISAEVPNHIAKLWVESCDFWNGLIRQAIFRPGLNGTTVRVDASNNSVWAYVQDGDVYICPKLLNATAPIVSVRQRNVLKHEGGHLLGLDHSSSWRSVMHPDPDDYLFMFKTSLPSGELRALREMYP